MNRSAIRRELVEEHAKLRGLIEDVREAARLARGSEAMRRELHTQMERLNIALRAHNRHEEELLKGILVTIDAWGAVRAEILSEEHVAEHVELCAMITDAKATSHSAILDGTVGSLLDDVLKHMSREEIAFLGEDVLRDDDVIVLQVDG
jgi:hypothetical protein